MTEAAVVAAVVVSAGVAADTAARRKGIHGDGLGSAPALPPLARASAAACVAILAGCAAAAVRANTGAAPSLAVFCPFGAALSLCDLRLRRMPHPVSAGCVVFLVAAHAGIPGGPVVASATAGAAAVTLARVFVSSGATLWSVRLSDAAAYGSAVAGVLLGYPGAAVAVAAAAVFAVLYRMRLTGGGDSLFLMAGMLVSVAAAADTGAVLSAANLFLLVLGMSALVMGVPSKQRTGVLRQGRTTVKLGPAIATAGSLTAIAEPLSVRVLQML